MVYRVVNTAEAKRDLKRAAAYIRPDSPVAAVRGFPRFSLVSRHLRATRHAAPCLFMQTHSKVP